MEHPLMRRRGVLLGLLGTALAWPRLARPGHLPPGLDPRAIGAALRAAHPGCSAAACRARAALADLGGLGAASAADFARGDTVTVDGWVLSRTEAWLCATLA
jgi:hypothetical protein